jgi:hypothetical protein
MADRLVKEKRDARRSVVGSPLVAYTQHAVSDPPPHRIDLSI